uniref:Uncharacterized protein n=1 Tax=Magallana gigas TaxID=29159 RepID=K1PNC9_MAGGI
MASSFPGSLGRYEIRHIKVVRVSHYVIIRILQYWFDFYKALLIPVDKRGNCHLVKD